GAGPVADERLQRVVRGTESGQVHGVSISTGACRCARLARMRSPRAETFTRVIDAVFACNGGFLAAGDALTAPVGLTAAQWQVLGFLEDGPATAAEVARRRGLRRQSVQETVNRLLRNGML